LADEVPILSQEGSAPDVREPLSHLSPWMRPACILLRGTEALLLPDEVPVDKGRVPSGFAEDVNLFRLGFGSGGQ